MFAFDLHTKCWTNSNFFSSLRLYTFLIKCFKTLILNDGFPFLEVMNFWASNCCETIDCEVDNVLRNSRTSDWIFASAEVLHFWNGFVEHLFRWSHYMVNFQRKPCTFSWNKLIYIQYGRILAVGFFLLCLSFSHPRQTVIKHSKNSPPRWVPIHAHSASLQNRHPLGFQYSHSASECVCVSDGLNRIAKTVFLTPI